MNPTDPLLLNVLGPTQLISSGLNKTPKNSQFKDEGIAGELIDEFTLKLSDDELLSLAQKWELKYGKYEAQIKLRQEKNKAYYLGKQSDNQLGSGEVISANLLFEAEETFLPAALSKNPEPVVFSDNTEQGNEVSNSVKTMLQYHADVLGLRQKLGRMTRHWSIYFLGALKHGWDKSVNDITSDLVDVRNLILDPDSSIDVMGNYTGQFLGERKTVTAQELIDLFPKHQSYITIMVDGKLGTDVIYTEWWNDDYCFYTFKERVLDKNKNPHFNYDSSKEETDEDGYVTDTKVQGKNHFAKPKKPYTFLSVFSLGEQPHDITSLIEQNIPNQNLVTRRTNQIDVNLTMANNSLALSEDNFNQETGKQASNARKIGNPILVPKGRPIAEAILDLPAQSYPDSAFKQLEVSKNDLRQIFGTQGITAQPPNEDTTARGMILSQQYDNTRIGGGIGDALAQVADNTFNWWVQLYFVYYDDEHLASIMGQMKAVEYVILTRENLDRKLVVSVAPDSMKPKDEITRMNLATQLWQEGALDPKTLLTMLDFPDPQETAESTVLWLLDKNTYLQLNFPELAQKLAQISQQANSQASVGAQPQGQSPSPPPNVSAPSASASLSNVPLPK